MILTKIGVTVISYMDPMGDLNKKRANNGPKPYPPTRNSGGMLKTGSIDIFGVRVTVSQQHVEIARLVIII